MRYFSLLAILCLTARPALALVAGAAVADITPDAEKYTAPLAGNGAREGKPATGVHDPLLAKGLFLRNGDTHAGPAMHPEPFWQLQFGKYDPAIAGTALPSEPAK